MISRERPRKQKADSREQKDKGSYWEGYRLIQQTSIAWKPDGQHIAIGLFNKSIMTFYVGDLKRPVGVKGEDWKMD